MQFMAGRRPLGSWRWDVGTDSWTWDESITRLHGYGPPDAPVPSTELVIVHTLRSDREAILGLLAQLRREPAPFAASLRIQSVAGEVVPVTIAGQPEPRNPRVLSGWVVPIAGDGPAAESETATGGVASTVAALAAQVEHLHRALDSRDVIGRAKGIVSARTGLDDQAAFELLSKVSQNANVRLVTIAERLVAHAETAQVPERDRRAFCDELLALVTARSG